MTTSEPYPTDATSPTIHVQYPSSREFLLYRIPQTALAVLFPSRQGNPLLQQEVGAKAKAKAKAKAMVDVRMDVLKFAAVRLRSGRIGSVG
jgi:hypothetical protein